jgi:hypothetical protein
VMHFSHAGRSQPACIAGRAACVQPGGGTCLCGLQETRIEGYSTRISLAGGQEEYSVDVKFLVSEHCWSMLLQLWSDLDHYDPHALPHASSKYAKTTSN